MEKKTLNKKTWKSWELEEKIGYKFCAPAWAFLPQVRNGTGYSRRTRTADALAMSLYPSRGLDLHGFEIKIYRGDWLSELKNPEKAEEIAQFCDYWWIVAPKEIIKLEEVPSKWGVMIPFGKTLKIIKKAEELKSKKVDKLFLASILRKTQETLTPDAKLEKEYKKGLKEGKEQAQCNFKWAKENHESLKKKISEFEKASGVTIDSWDCDNIGQAVRQVLNGEHNIVKNQLDSLLTKAKEIVKFLEKNLEIKDETKLEHYIKKDKK